MKIHKISSFDTIEAKRNVWHPIGDKTGNIENYFRRWMNNKYKVYFSIQDSKAIYLPIRFVDFFKIYATGQTHPNKSKIKFILDKLYTPHFNQNSHKYFTVCQWSHGPTIDMKNAMVFTASAYNDKEIPIPLCTDPHPRGHNPKTILGSFVGNFVNHGIRARMQKILQNNERFVVRNATSNIKLFRNIMNSSKFALCPKGTGPSSFRIYEALQLGVVPVIISDNYRRPYADEVDWNSFSITVKEKDLPNIAKILSDAEPTFESRSKAGLKFHEDYCTRDKVCEHILRKVKNRLG